MDLEKIFEVRNGSNLVSKIFLIDIFLGQNFCSASKAIF